MSDPKSRNEMRATAELWRFSLAFYARPGVAEALIALQDRAGRDVNVVLFALWCGAVRGRPLSSGAFAAATAAIRTIGDGIVAPLRIVRQKLKTEYADPLSQALRRRVLQLELAGEWASQARLAAIAATPVIEASPVAPNRTDAIASDRLAAAMANLSLYLGDDAGSYPKEVAQLRDAVAELARVPADTAQTGPARNTVGAASS
jgi:uncharacterized protein (TIGR02444 family)